MVRSDHVEITVDYVGNVRIWFRMVNVQLFFVTIFLSTIYYSYFTCVPYPIYFSHLNSHFVKSNDSKLEDGDRIDYVKLAQLQNDVKLVAWIRTQQYEYQLLMKKSSDSFLTSKRKDKLEELRIDWNYGSEKRVIKLQNEWICMFQQLQQYQR